MKKHLAYAFALLLLSFCSCRKIFPIPPPPVDSTAIAIDFTDHDNFDSLHQDKWELIINEPSGKLLLDTVANENTAIKATLHSSSQLVNFTLVEYLSSFGTRYTITTYRNVDPRTWKGLPSQSFLGPVNADPVSFTSAQLNYIHPPSLPIQNYPDITLSTSRASSGFSVLSYDPNYAAYQPGGLLSVSYNRAGNNPIYTLMPQLGLYKFHAPTSNNDTVDLSHLDTAVSVNYSLPASFTPQSTDLFGYSDTTDLTKSTQLYDNFYDGELPADVEYPRTGVQTYELIEYVANTSNQGLYFYSYGSKVPATINWVNPTDFTISANQQDSFSVAYNGAKPSFYSMNWQAGNNIYFEIYSAPDGTVLHPYTWFSGLGSKLLQGQNLASMKPSFAVFTDVTGLPADLNGALNYYGTAAPRVSAPVGSTIMQYQISF